MDVVERALRGGLVARGAACFVAAVLFAVEPLEEDYEHEVASEDAEGEKYG
jgi:hypothetical protein